MKKNKLPNILTSFKTNKGVGTRITNESAEDFFEKLYGSEEYNKIAIRFNWRTRADYEETIELWNKPNNLERVKHIIDTEIFHNRGLRPILNKYKLQDNKADLLDSLVSFGLLRVQKYYAPNVRSRSVFIYSLLTIPEEKRLAYLMPFLSKTALENLKSEEGG